MLLPLLLLLLFELVNCEFGKRSVKYLQCEVLFGEHLQLCV